MRRLLPLLCLTATVAHTTPALEGFYFGLVASGSYFPTIDYQTPWPSTFTTPFTNLTTTTATTSLAYSIGGGGGADLGYRFRCFRLEGELLYIINKMNKITYQGLTVGHSKTLANLTGAPYLRGQTSEYMGLINLYYDIRLDNPHGSGMIPYIGIGIGYDSMHYASNFSALDWLYGTQNPLTLPGTQNRETASGAIGQGIIGINYDMDSFVSFFMDFRYLSLKTTSATKNTTTASSALSSRIPLYTFNLGFNYVFSKS